MLLQVRRILYIVVLCTPKQVNECSSAVLVAKLALLFVTIVPRKNHPTTPKIVSPPTHQGQTTSLFDRLFVREVSTRAQHSIPELI